MIGGRKPSEAALVPRTRDAVEIEIMPLDDKTVEVFVTLPAWEGEALTALRAAMPEPEPRVQVQHRASWRAIRAEREKIRAHIAKVFKTPRYTSLLPESFTALDETLTAEALAGVARAGRALFDLLFQPIDDYLAPVGAPENLVRAAVLEAVRRPGRIDVRCQDDPALPWAFVYDPALDPTVDEEVVRFERFWGFVHELQVEHANTARDPRIAVPFVLKAAACPRVDSARSARQDDRTLHGSAVTSGRLDWIDDAEKLRTALRELDGDGLYVLGHAGSGDSGAPSDRWIQFDGAKVYVSDLLRAPRPARSERQALVFLNACESAAIEEWDECTLPGALLKRHADRITLIGTTAEVPRLLAMAFAKEFWRRFLGGSTAGEALLDTRVCLLREYTNPFGLLYTLHGKADTHLRAPDETTDVGVVAREERVVARPLAASFAEVCTDPRKIEMFVYSAGVPRSLVYVHQSPLKAWESVCDVARRFGRTEALTAVVVEYYPRVFDVVSTRSV